jgi:hypothetical protein
MHELYIVLNFGFTPRCALCLFKTSVVVLSCICSIIEGELSFFF